MDAPSLVPSIESPAHPDAASDQDEIETFAARRTRLQARRKQASKSSRWTALVLVLFAFNVTLVGAQRGRAIFPADGVALCGRRAARSICAT
jgi:hypothetical protein